MKRKLDLVEMNVVELRDRDAHIIKGGGLGDWLGQKISDMWGPSPPPCLCSSWHAPMVYPDAGTRLQNLMYRG